MTFHPSLKSWALWIRVLLDHCLEPFIFLSTLTSLPLSAPEELGTFSCLRRRPVLMLTFWTENISFKRQLYCIIKQKIHVITLPRAHSLTANELKWIVVIRYISSFLNIQMSPFTIRARTGHRATAARHLIGLLFISFYLNSFINPCVFYNKSQRGLFYYTNRVCPHRLTFEHLWWGIAVEVID